MSSPTVVAIGLDPEKGTVELMLKTDKGEQRKTMPLQPEQRLYFDMLKVFVERYL